MDQAKDFFYPVLPETLHRYASSLFNALTRGESVTTIWVPMAGRRMENKFLIENIALFENELPDYQKFILVYIEPLDLTEESLVGYVRLMGTSLRQACAQHPECQEVLENCPEFALFDDEQTTYPRLLDALKTTIRKSISSGHHVVFFLGEFDELHKFSTPVFYNNLKSLWDTFRPKLHYVFLTVEDLSRPVLTERFGELNAALLENVLYISIHNDDNIEYFLDRAETNLGITLSPEDRQMIKGLCGGHPYLIKAAVRVLSSLGSPDLPTEQKRHLLESHYELLSVAKRMYNLRTDNEQAILQKVINKEPYDLKSPAASRLVKLGFLKRVGENYEIFSELLAEIIAAGPISESTVTLEKTPKTPFTLTLSKTGEILDHNEKPIDDRFTRQEYELLRFFLKEPGKLQTRESISEVLWGENSYEKYSDWAIDQVMSKLRKKLKLSGSKTSLQTIRGRGYRLS